MYPSKPSRLTVVVAALLITSPRLEAQNRNDDEPRVGYSAILNNIDMLIDNYALFVGRKYDLTPEQDAFTRQLLHTKSREFLDRHEGELRAAVDRMFEVRSGGAMDPQELITWGKTVMPMYTEAKRVIVESNDEWRKILTEDQRRIHDEDLKLMTDSFQSVEEQLQRIVTGHMTVEEFRRPVGRRSSPRNRAAVSKNVPPPSQTAHPAPVEPGLVGAPPTAMGPEPVPMGATPTGPDGTTFIPPDQTAQVIQQQQGNFGGQPPQEMPPHQIPPQDIPPQEIPPAEVQPMGQAPEAMPQPEPVTPESRRRNAPGAVASRAGKDYESQWDAYVRQFIEKYKLNEDQSQRANLILKDCKGQAERYMRGHAGDIERLDARLAEVNRSTSKDKGKEIASISEERAKLLEPIDRIFEGQLKPKLDKLPTRAQRRAAEAAAKKNPSAGNRPAGSRSGSGTP